MWKLMLPSIFIEELCTSMLQSKEVNVRIRSSFSFCGSDGYYFYDHKVGGHENQAKSHNSRCPQVFTTSTTRDTFDLKAALLKHRNLSVFDLTFPGTHNSAINLSPKLEDMPRGTEYSTTHPSVAIRPFPYTVLNQRLSVYDQLEHGIRYLIF